MGACLTPRTFNLAATLALWAGLRVVPLVGQAPPPKLAGPTVQIPPAATSVEAEPYSYNPEGRRDPFVSLIARGTEPRTVPKGSVTGLSGLTTAELSVRGIVTTKGRYIAMVQGPDSRTYIVHPNDRLVDGVITRITAQGLVILQEVNDPLSLVKQREVRKTLRSAEEGK
jgi:Tfp pilus assembly protein PilP